MDRSTGEVPVIPDRQLHQATVSGAAWNLVTALGNKLVTLVGQLVLAWLLMPEDFGLVALVIGITGLVGAVVERGISDRLVQAQDPTPGFLQQCFWLSLALRCGCLLVMLLALPGFAALAGDERVKLLIAIEVATWPLECLWQIPENQALRQLRFRLVALTHLSRSLTYTIAAVALAWCGLGPLALILAQVPAKLVQWCVFALAVERVPMGWPQPREWPALLAPVSWLMLSTGLLTIQATAIAPIIGVVHTIEVAGYFSWAYQVAMQAVFLLATNLGRVFFPVLSALGDDETTRQRMARRMLLLVMAALVPAMILQAVAAAPLIHWVYGDKWDRAIPVIQILSAGFVPFPLAIIGNSLLKSRGEFRRLALVSAVQAGMTLTGGIIGLNLGGEQEAAWGFSLGLAVSSLMTWRVALRPATPVRGP